MDKIDALKNKIRHFIKLLDDGDKSQNLTKLYEEINAEYKALFGDLDAET